MQMGEFFCPHYCISCGKVGGILCGRCKKYILKQFVGRCLVCDGELSDGVCANCAALPFRRQFWVGERDGALKNLIEIYKYKSVRAAGWVLAGLLNEVIEFDVDTKIVSLPTIMKHVRERGFDHTAKIAQDLARMNKLKVAQVLVRGNNAVQVGASEERRKEQAKTAYIAKTNIDREANYLLIDDVWTTGSSMMAACNALRAVGCERINIAIIAKSNN